MTPERHEIEAMHRYLDTRSEYSQLLSKPRLLGKAETASDWLRGMS